MTDTLLLQPAHVQLAALRDGRISALELLQQQRIWVERHNPALNAVVLFRWEAAEVEARALDARRARGEPLGALHGLPVTVKEIFELQGLPTTVGDPRLKSHVSRSTAPAVQRLIDAGAVVYGKTNMPMHGVDLQSFNAVYGVTNNPWDVSRTPGGSSGGSAAALAAGFAALELGSDLGGSIRCPAHFCGIYGHKPTFGLVPTRGHFAGPGRVSTMDLTVAGPMARSAEDLALMLEVLAGPEGASGRRWPVALPPPAHAALADFTVGVWFDDASAPVDAEVLKPLHAAVARLEAAGVKVRRGAPDGLKIDDFYADYFHLMAAAVGGLVEAKLFKKARVWARLTRLFGKGRVNTLTGYCQGMIASHRDWIALHEARCRMQARLARYFASGVDVLLLPNTVTTALPHHGVLPEFYKRRIPVNGAEAPYTDQLKWIGLASHLGLPATSAPVGFSEKGLPVGVQIVGPELGDTTTIAFARLMAGVLGGYQVPPGLAAA